MKTKNLLLALASVTLFSASAATNEDITPTSYRFKDQPVGQVNFFAGAVKGANPDIPLADTFAGKGVISGGQISVDNAATVAAFVNAGASIVETSDGDKVLLIKGKNSTESASAPAATGSLGGWNNFHLYSDATAGLKNVTLRCQAIIKVVPACEIKISTVGKSGTALGVGTIAYTSYDEKWWPVTFDRPTSSDQMPVRIKFDNPVGFDDRAFYIGLLNYTVDPSEPIPSVGEEGLDRPFFGTGGVSAEVSDKSFIAWDNQNIYLNDITIGSQVQIFNISGSLVKSVEVTNGFMEVPMNSGIYIVKFGAKTAKVIM